MNVFDAHIHVQPWQMVKPEALALIDRAIRDATNGRLGGPVEPSQS